MFYTLGGETYNDIWVKKDHCPKCKGIQNFHLNRWQFKVVICWVPFLSITVKRALVCEKCGHEEEMKAWEYWKIRRLQFKELKKGEFPDDVVLNNYNPKEIGFKSRIVKLIVVAWICSGILFNNEWELSNLYILLLAVVLPCVLTIKNSIPVFKKRKAYKKLVKKYKKENMPLS